MYLKSTERLLLLSFSLQTPTSEIKLTTTACFLCLLSRKYASAGSSKFKAFFSRDDQLDFILRQDVAAICDGTWRTPAYRLAERRA